MISSGQPNEFWEVSPSTLVDGVLKLLKLDQIMLSVKFSTWKFDKLDLSDRVLPSDSFPNHCCSSCVPPFHFTLSHSSPSTMILRSPSNFRHVHRTVKHDCQSTSSINPDRRFKFIESTNNLCVNGR